MASSPLSCGRGADRPASASNCCAVPAIARRISVRLASCWPPEQGYLDTDGGMMFIGPEAERRFGHRHFMSLMAVFTAPPEFTVLHGRDEIGRVDPSPR